MCVVILPALEDALWSSSIIHCVRWTRLWAMMMLSTCCKSVIHALYNIGVVRRPGAPVVDKMSALDVSKLCEEKQLAAVAADPGNV